MFLPLIITHFGHRLRISTKLSRTKILTQQLGQFRHMRTLQRWVKAGAAYAIFASAGNSWSMCATFDLDFVLV